MVENDLLYSSDVYYRIDIQKAVNKVMKWIQNNSHAIEFSLTYKRRVL